MNMKDHFVIMLLCEYILVLLSIKPMGNHLLPVLGLLIMWEGKGTERGEWEGCVGGRGATTYGFAIDVSS